MIDRLLELSELGMILDWGLHRLELFDAIKTLRILHRFLHGAIWVVENLDGLILLTNRTMKGCAGRLSPGEVA